MKDYYEKRSIPQANRREGNVKPEKLILLPNSRVRVIYNTGKEEVKKARGILMKPWGIQATLEGRKIQTRRIRFYGTPGELVYIKEPHWEYGMWHCEGTQWISMHGYCYEDPQNTIFWRKKSPLFMPREAARYWLYIDNIRVERVQDISIQDIKKEGLIKKMDGYYGKYYKEYFKKIWDEINANRRDIHGNRLPYSWADNPVVYVITYRLFFQGRGVVE